MGSGTGPSSLRGRPDRSVASSCCAPTVDRERRSASASRPLDPGWPSSARVDDGAMVRLPGGSFRMGNPRGDGYAADGEGPVREVRLDPFWIDRTTVTNAAFARFVEATGHRTESESYGWSFVFAGLLPDDL